MAGSERSLLIKFIGESKSLEDASAQADKAIGGVGLSLGKLAQGAAFAKVTQEMIGFAKDSVGAALEDKQAQEQLALALRNSVGATKEQIAAVEESIGKLQAQTGVLDDELRPAFSTLIRATKDTEAATRIMTIANDVAVGKGKDLGAVSDALAKAYQGNTKGLKDLGVELKNADGSAKSFNEISQELVTLYGGAAKTAFDADPAKQLRVQLENLKETVGNALLPVVITLAGAAEDVLGWFNALSPATQQLMVWIGLVGGGVMAAVKSFGALATSIEALGVTASISVPWLVAIGAAIAGAIAVFSMFSDETDKGKEATDHFNESVRGAAGGLDVQKLAFLDTAEAARRYREEVYAGLDKETRDKIAGDNEMVAAMNHYGFTMEEVIAATHDAAAAQALLNRTHTTEYVKAYNAASEEQRRGMQKLIELATLQGAAGSEVAAQNVELAKTGDLIAISYLKATGQMEKLTPAQQAAAEAALDKASADEQAAAAAAAATQAETEHEQALKDAQAAAEAAEKATRDLIDARLASIDSTYAVRDAEDRLAEAFAAVKADDPATVVDEFRQSNDDAAQAALALAIAVRDNAVAMAESAGAPMDAAAANQVLIDSLHQTVLSLGPDSPVRQALIDHIATLQGVPASKSTKVTVTGTGPAKADLGDVAAAADKVKAETKTDSKADTAVAKTALDELTVAAEGVPTDIKMAIGVPDVDPAISALDRLARKLDEVQRKADKLEGTMRRVAG